MYEYNPTIRTTDTRRARKTYACCECSSMIQRGDTYEYVAGLWDGYWSTFRTCDRCAKLREKYLSRFEYGNLQDALGVHYTTESFHEICEKLDLKSVSASSRSERKRVCSNVV
jgi:hypothetical protein